MPNRNSLKISDASPAEQSLLMQAINEKPHKAVITKSSVFLRKLSVKSVSKASNRYYGVRLVQAKHGSYVEFHHRIPPDLAQQLPPEYIKKEWLDKAGRLLEWARFRWKGQLNSVTAEDFPQAAAEYLLSVKMALQNGLDPFKEYIKEYKGIHSELTPVMSITKDTKPKVTVEKAMEKFLQSYGTGPSRVSYEVITRLLSEWLGDRVKDSIKDITRDDLYDLLLTKQEEKDWKKGTYNDKLRKLKTFFSFAKDAEWIKDSPAEKLKFLTHVDKTRHTAYTDEMADKIKSLLLNHKMQPTGLETYRFCMTVYYTCTRPDEETRQLMCKDIRFDSNQIYIDPERAKGGQGGFIDLAPEMRDLLIEMGVDKAPGDYYIFGKGATPGPECYNESRFAWFFREHVRRPNNIGEEYTIYGFKHKRVIDLFKSGALPVEIQRQCRHKSPTEFETYLRDLGLNRSSDINARAKKF